MYEVTVVLHCGNKCGKSHTWKNIPLKDDGHGQIQLIGPRERGFYRHDFTPPAGWVSLWEPPSEGPEYYQDSEIEVFCSRECAVEYMKKECGAAFYYYVLYEYQEDGQCESDILDPDAEDE